MSTHSSSVSAGNVTNIISLANELDSNLPVRLETASETILEFTNHGTTPDTTITKTVDNVAADDIVLVMSNTSVSGTSVGTLCVVTHHVDSVDQANYQVHYEPAGTNSGQTGSVTNISAYQDLSAGTHTFGVNIAQYGTAGTVYTQHRWLTILIFKRRV